MTDAQLDEIRGVLAELQEFTLDDPVRPPPLSETEVLNSHIRFLTSELHDLHEAWERRRTLINRFALGLFTGFAFFGLIAGAVAGLDLKPVVAVVVLFMMGAGPLWAFLSLHHEHL